MELILQPLWFILTHQHARFIAEQQPARFFLYVTRLEHVPQEILLYADLLHYHQHHALQFKLMSITMEQEYVPQLGPFLAVLITPLSLVQP